MGVDFSHGDAHWSYNGFNYFRVLLAKQVAMERSMDFPGIKCRADVIANYELALKVTEKDRIHPLIDHSDCDGDLSPEVCLPVAERILDIVEKWEKYGTNYDSYDIDHGKRLAAGMLEAHTLGEKFVFC